MLQIWFGGMQLSEVMYIQVPWHRCFEKTSIYLDLCQKISPVMLCQSVTADRIRNDAFSTAPKNDEQAGLHQDW